MQLLPTTVEEQLFLKAIKEECQWEKLPIQLQASFSKEEWHKRVIEYCIKKRLQWNACFARKVCKERDYYEEMIQYLRKNLSIFPYHLAEYICRVMRVSAFKYYCDMIFEVMRNEQPYDSIPNFSAADALRLTGIGRNEFIDLMNECRSKVKKLFHYQSHSFYEECHSWQSVDVLSEMIFLGKTIGKICYIRADLHCGDEKIRWKLNKSIAKVLLPKQPVDFSIEPWWGVCIVNFTLEEFKKLTEDETSTIDKICKEEANSFLLFDPVIVKGLFQRGLVYFDVPVYPDDRFKVSRLEGFVSNREQTYEDPIEELLYSVFVVSNENATVSELAATLQADICQLQAAASFACRLGWAVKIIDPGSLLRELNLPACLESDEDESLHISGSSSNLHADGNIGSQGSDAVIEMRKDISGPGRVAFVVDANITSYLMMGSVSPGLKYHAVSLYEAGKLADASISDLCKDLMTLEGIKFEGELQEFANHASSLRCVLECLKCGVILDSKAVERDDQGKNILASGNIVSSPDDVINNSVEPQTFSKDQIFGSNRTKPAESIIENDSNGQQSSEHITTNELEKIGCLKLDEKFVKEGKENSKTSKIENNKFREKCRHVDILRCESLAGLKPRTLDQLFSRDYDFIVSMIPLPFSSVLPSASGPTHFGPPSYSSMTPWMKLVLYSSACNGPLSVVLIKGQRLRLLPAPLAGCAKALLWSWDGSTIGGLGGKFEGNLVSGNILLHCLNSLLKYSGVLVQPLNKHDLNVYGKPITKDFALPLKSGSVTHTDKEASLDVEETANMEQLLDDLSNKIKLWTIGYIRLIRLHRTKEMQQQQIHTDKYEWVPLSIEFGIPLFNPKLCSTICQSIVLSELLQSESLTKHQESMHALRKRLHDICSEYHSTGPVAKFLYKSEQGNQRRDSLGRLLTFSSRRWNPLLEASSPLATTAEHQRIKLLNRHHSHCDILIFDGSTLRSYALNPPNDMLTNIDESTSRESHSGKKQEYADGSGSKDVPLPGVNLLFDGSQLNPFDIGACLQAQAPALLIAEAATASSSTTPRER